jgi:hypothetical protein
MLWIALAGLREPVPEPWLTCKKVGASHIFFHNPDTGQSTWEHPQDQIFKELVSDYLAHRVTVPVTLMMRAAAFESSTDAVEIVAHKLSGNETSTRIAHPASVAFEQVRCDLEGQLCQSLPANAVLRFFLPDGTQLGRSHGARTVAEVFQLPRSDAPATDICPRLPVDDCHGGKCAQKDIKLAHGVCFSL